MTRQNSSSVLRRAALAVVVSTVAATVSLTAASASTAVRISGADDPGRIPGRYLVELRPGLFSGHQAGTVSREHGGRLESLFRNVGSFLFAGSAGDAAALARDPRVAAIEADRKVQLADDVRDKNTNGIRRMGVRRPTDPPTAPADSTRCPYPNPDPALGASHTVACDYPSVTGTGSRIAIIDTGVDQDHPEFHNGMTTWSTANTNDRIALDRAKCDSNAVLTSTTTGQNIADDGDGHGTRNAGNAAAGGYRIFGVAPNATIVPVKVALKVSAITCGVNYVTGLNNDNLNVEPGANDVPIVNISLVWGEGGTTNACDLTNSVAAHAMCDLYNSLTGKVFIAAAAGNNFRNLSGTAPAKWDPQTVAVSAGCDRTPAGDPGVKDGLANFSNWGAIDVMAPGCKIFSPENGNPGDAKYTTQTGTSRAAPHIAGLAALYLQAHPGSTSQQILDAMKFGGDCPGSVQGTMHINGTTGNCNASYGPWPKVKYKDNSITGTDPDGASEPFPLAICVLYPTTSDPC